MTADILFDTISSSPKPAGATELPFRDRALLPPLSRFGPAEDGFELFVTSDAEAMLRAETGRFAPNEAFGMLMGRAFIDQRGPYTVISGATYASPARTGPGHVRLSPAEMTALQRAALRSFPSADPVGWTHSHPRPSPFSAEDEREQATWPADYHVGIVTFMDVRPGEPWAMAYRGPTAEPLPLMMVRPPALQPGRSKPDSGPLGPAADIAKRAPGRAPTRVALGTWSVRRRRTATSPRAVLTSFVLLGLLGLALTLWRADRLEAEVAALEARVGALECRATLPPPVTPASAGTGAAP